MNGTSLGHLSALVSLSLLTDLPAEHGGSFRLAGLASLPRLPSLERLRLSCGVCSGLERLLSKATSLKHLYISWAEVGPGALSALARCSSLKTLELESVWWEQGDAEALQQLATLTQVVGWGN